MRTFLGTAAAVVLTSSFVPMASSAGDEPARAAGLSWKRVDLPHSHQSLRGLDAVGAKVAWVSGDEGGVWRTTDGGKTWKDVRPDAEKELAFRDVEADSARSPRCCPSGRAARAGSTRRPTAGSRGT